MYRSSLTSYGLRRAGGVRLVGLLNYVPSLALGPVAEHLALWVR